MKANDINNRVHNHIVTRRYTFKAGVLMLGVCDGRLCLCDWVHSPHFSHVLRRVCTALGAEAYTGQDRALDIAVEEIDRYLVEPSRIPQMEVIMAGTPFQKVVWSALKTILPGNTVTYAELAGRITGDRRWARAVAQAVGANAMSIFLPCHRVVAGSGIGGYAGGIEAKIWLLNHEKNVTLQP